MTTATQLKLSDYKQGIKFLLSLETQGIKMGLNRTKQLLTVCNNPEKNLKTRLKILKIKTKLYSYDFY